MWPLISPPLLIFFRNTEYRNQTFASGFILLGLTDDPELQLILFGIFLFMYLVTVLGNLIIILAVILDSHLHTPMYFFLSNLSFTDICFITSTVPKMLVNIQRESNAISYTDCLTQMYFVVFLGGMENFLLAAMAYDRYVAICHPLRYTVMMNPSICIVLTLLSILSSMIDALLHSLLVLRLSFCTYFEIPHFFCELAHVIKLSCSDTLINNIVIYMATFIFGGLPFWGIILSYVKIVSSVLKQPSKRHSYKALSTCGSHLLVVSLFYGSVIGVYISFAVTDSTRKTAVASVLYTVVPQMLNPFVYSLRNKDMKEAMRKLSVGIV
ncbi:olfactory receptor Olr1139 [Rattus norvegicus]|uniref:Olfactory receptor n=1 Tax=Rattus norvegicus TaxID=10116 RepID=D4AB09_RAT|nr:olfactory receptor Olr1139 [Rattus norvegicus]|eukprot:NP_001000427.1 olfactory receptor Olr1139 [Rattus norvegicus]